MSTVDLIVLFGTLAFIVIYGSLKTKNSRDIKAYFKGDENTRWWTVGLSVMATQASAITFISTPGKAFEDGMGFVQNYFGLPIALVIICMVFIPIYYKLKVYTAYEYLESRFDKKTRLLGASIFLLQRGLAAGITIYAPAIILSKVLEWNLTFTILLVGILVIIYTVSGGTRAVNLTHKWQMGIIMFGMFFAFGYLVYYLPEGISFFDSLKIAGKMDKMEVVDFSFDVSKRYTFWSGILGATFLSLSYFGTDQSQVQRYLSGGSIRESRLGLIFNAILKIPMQFFILLTGVMVFVFYQFYEPPIFFKENETKVIQSEEFRQGYQIIEERGSAIHAQKKELIFSIVERDNSGGSTNELDAELSQLNSDYQNLRNEAKTLAKTHLPTIETKDSDYVFLSFIMNYLPMGLIGLLLAVIFSAAMSSTAGEINALASTTVIDYYKRLFKPEASDSHYLIVSKGFTLLWGLLAIGFAIFAHLAENLIEAVNILGSVFYGTVLGIFLTAFFLKKVKGNAVFWSAVIAQSVVIALHFMNDAEIINISYLWYNAIGCLLVLMLSSGLTKVIVRK